MNWQIIMGIIFLVFGVCNMTRYQTLPLLIIAIGLTLLIWGMREKGNRAESSAPEPFPDSDDFPPPENGKKKGAGCLTGCFTSIVFVFALVAVFALVSVNSTVKQAAEIREITGTTATTEETRKPLDFKTTETAEMATTVPETTTAPTEAPTETPTTVPTEVSTTEATTETTEAPTEATSAKRDNEPFLCFADRNTKIYHNSWCDSAPEFGSPTCYSGYMSPAELEADGYRPCGKCIWGASPEAETTSPAEEKREFIVNKNSKKFHYTWCSFAPEPDSDSYSLVTSTAQELSQKGYSPCQKCIG